MTQALRRCTVALGAMLLLGAAAADPAAALANQPAADGVIVG